MKKNEKRFTTKVLVLKSSSSSECDGPWTVISEQPYSLSYKQNPLGMKLLENISLPMHRLFFPSMFCKRLWKQIYVFVNHKHSMYTWKEGATKRHVVNNSIYGTSHIKCFSIVIEKVKRLHLSFSIF